MRHITIILLLLAVVSVSSAEPFAKIHRRGAPLPLVTFDGRPGDFELQPFIAGGRVFVSMTDLLRHVGGTLLWGPSDGQLSVFRDGIELTGHIHYGLRDDQVIVPLRSAVALMGLDVHWNGRTADVR